MHVQVLNRSPIPFVHTETHRQMDVSYGTYHFACLLRDTPRIDIARYTRLCMGARSAVLEVCPCGGGCTDGRCGRVLAFPGRGWREWEGRKGEGGKRGCRRMCEGLGGRVALIGR